jgi:hypothetical protein
LKINKDELAKIIREWFLNQDEYAECDDYRFDICLDGYFDLVELAEYILTKLFPVLEEPK